MTGSSTHTTDYSPATATAQLTVGPSITTQPVSQTVTDGSAATFSVVAGGVAPLTYHWQYLDGTNWKRFGAGTGHNTATLTTFATTAAYNGLQLRLVVTDAQGNTATSNAVTLTVAPSITTQPVSQTVTDGSAATFSVAAAGVPTLTYKWQYLDGTAWKGFGAGTGYNTATVTTFATTAAYNGLQLRVVVTDGDGKTATSNAVSLTVNAATPAISWTAPAAITYGTALSATQLDATSTVAGTFAYSPVAGTVLTAGTHTITATFTPTDTTDYKTVTATVGLKVIQAAPSLSWNVPAAITYGTALSATQLNASSTVAGTFAYNPAAGTVLKAGTQTISVTFTPTDSTDYSTATSAVSVSVNAATPVITWNTPAAIAYGTALSATQLDASSTVAGAFAYNPAAGTVLTAGMHTITATFTPTDSTDYSTATSTGSISVNAATPAITWTGPAAIAYGTALSATQLNASSTVAGSFSYSPAAGTVLTAGTHSITATFTPTNSTDYSTATGTVSITVNTSAPVITWNTPAAITYGTALSATQLNASSTVAGTFAYSPAAGTVLTAGSHKITATFTPTDSTDYSTAASAVSVSVNAATPAITWAAPAAITYGTALSATQLNASSTVAGSFSYSPASGTVLTAGIHTITATFTPTDSTDYSTATSAVSVSVNAATPAITWAAPAAITYGAALSAKQLNASSTVAGSFSYSPALGTVLPAGSHTITATFTPTDSTDYSTATSTGSITVNAATPIISWTGPAAITYGTALSATQLNASSTVAGSFSYSPASGTVLTAGIHTITASFTPTDSTDYSTATSTGSITVNAATPIISWTGPAAITYGAALSATQLNASSTVAGSFSYSPASGTVLTAGIHTITATFTPTDSTDYSTATSAVSVSVNAATPAITWAAPAAITYGAALSAKQLNASSTVAGSFSYSPALGTVLPAGSHTITASFTPTDSTDYSTATSTGSITVNAATPIISWTGPAAITYGTALSATQLNASSTVAGAFAYSPALGTVLTAGSHTITATFTPTDSTDYSTATSAVSVSVNAATPAITWAGPAAITYGTALSATQLNASSTVAGAFAYSPALGTVLTAGSHTITATFTPTDSTDYSTATSTVSITVNAATPGIIWATPAAIISGTALSSTQLNATSTVPGSFVYSPAASTVLSAGSQTLSVTFTPTDTTDYTSATQTVTLSVAPASAFVQEGDDFLNSSSNSLSVSFPANTSAGDLILVGLVFNTSATPSSVSDSQGNTFTPVGTTLTSSGGTRSAVYYAKNIKGGADTVTVTLSANSGYILGYLTEYSGVDKTNPIDAQVGTAGSTGTVSSGNAATTFSGDVIYSFCAADDMCTAGSGFAARSTFEGNIIEDQTAGSPGSYAGTGSANSSWTMQLVALKSALSGYAEAAPTITSATTASGNVGSAFSYQITSSGIPTSYGATGLPTGLSVNTTSGLISGTPTTAGTPTVTLSATNNVGAGNATLALTIVAAPLITSAATANGTPGSAFSYQITASNIPTSYGATGLPTGLSVNTASGLISGTPTAAGTSTVTLGATNSAGTGNATLTLTIVAAPVITSAATANGKLGSAFTYQITASNIPTSYGATGLPTGLSVNTASGLISGTPTTAGTSTVTLGATNSAGTGNATMTLTIVAAPVITSAATASGTVGSAFSYQITASNIPTSFAATGLPGGLTVNSGTGLISGTPTAAGTSTATMSASNTGGTGSATLTLTIAAAAPTLSINATSVPFGNVVLNTPTTQDVSLTSSGTTSVTVSSATVTGTSFTLSSGPTFPVTLTPGQTATLGVEFDPTTAGAATGQLTVTSTSSTNGTAVITLSGTGTAGSYAVDLSWDAPTDSTDPVAGYNVYRSPSGSSTYQLLNSLVDSQTTYVDSTVQSGQSYQYIVESVDGSGVESVPTSPITVTIP